MNEPGLVSGDLEELHDLGGWLCGEDVLLVGEDEERDARELLLLEELLQLLRRLVVAPLVRRIHHVHDRIRVGVIVLPVRPNVLLAANVPDVELEGAGLHRFDVEALRRCDRRNILARKRLQRRRLARVVEAKHEETQLLVILLEVPQQREEALRAAKKKRRASAGGGGTEENAEARTMALVARV